jgi:hypothetical protein
VYKLLYFVIWFLNFDDSGIAMVIESRMVMGDVLHSYVTNTLPVLQPPLKGDVLEELALDRDVARPSNER